MGVIDRHYETINRLFKKWNDPNEGCTNDELRKLKSALEAAREDVIFVLNVRRTDEEEK